MGDCEQGSGKIICNIILPVSLRTSIRPLSTSSSTVSLSVLPTHPVSAVTRRNIVSDLNNPRTAYLTSSMNYEATLMQVSSLMLLSVPRSKYEGVLISP